jgi:hypothetical protein
MKVKTHIKAGLGDPEPPGSPKASDPPIIVTGGGG